jgi:hypothetical protein
VSITAIKKSAGVNNTNDLRYRKSDLRSINGSLDLRFNQSIDWFLNSDYCTAKEPINFLYVNEANQLENKTVPWLENRNFSFSKGTYTPGDKVILYYANEIYLNFAAGALDVLAREHNFIRDIFNHYNIPCQDVLLLGNIHESDKNCSKLARMLDCRLLLIDYYELQTFLQTSQLCFVLLAWIYNLTPYLLARVVNISIDSIYAYIPCQSFSSIKFFLYSEERTKKFSPKSNINSYLFS